MSTSRGYLTEIYPSSIHFQDAKGNWQPIDNTLVPAGTAGFALKNKANGYSVGLPSTLSSPIGFSLPGGAIQFALDGAVGSLTAKGSTATYSNALAGTTVSYSAQADGLKEAISLSSAQAPTTFVYKLNLPGGWTARANSGGGIDIADGKGATQATFGSPFMFDASNKASGYSNAVKMTLAGTIGSQTITVAADPNWIADKSRVFPVVIDPSIWTNVNYYQGYDCFIQRSLPNTTACANTNYTGTTDFVGYDGTNLDRGLEYFAVQWNYVHIVPNSNILDAELDLTLASSSSSSAVPVTLYPTTRGWNPSGVTWSNSGADGGVPWTNPGGDYGAAISTVNVGPTAGTYAWYNLTQTVQNWVNGSSTNFGFLLRAANESQTGMLQFYNQNFNTANPTDPKNPHFRVYWNGWGGLQPFFTFSGFQADDHMAVAVNIANGQLVVHNHDFGVKGVGLNLAVDRYYNSLTDVQWDLGTGWSLNIDCEVMIDSSAHDGVVYWAPDNYGVLFRSNGSGGYITPPGINADLVKNVDGTFSMTFRVSGTKLNFQAGGCLQNEVDRNGNTVWLNYSGTLQSITDTENRSTTFSYNSTYSSSFITKITDSASRTYQYGYDTNGNLITYTDPNSKITRYAYNLNQQMSQITDPNGNVTNFSYSTTYPQPLTQISRVDPSCSGGACNTSFAYNSGAGTCTSSGIWMNTVITDANGHNTTYCYDNLGRVLEVRDALGNVKKAAYDANHDPTQITNALGQTTTMTYDSSYNLTRIQQPASSPGQTPGAVNFTYQTPGKPYFASSRGDSLGNCGAFVYDTSGNLTSVYSGQSSPCDTSTGGVGNCDAYQGDPAGTCGANAVVSCTGARAGQICGRVPHVL